MSGDEKEIRRSYASDDFYGVRDRVYEESVYAGDGTTLMSRTRTYFTKDGTTALPLGTVGKGWVFATAGRVEAVAGRPTSRLLTLRFRNGATISTANPISVYENGVWRTLGTTRSHYGRSARRCRRQRARP